MNFVIIYLIFFVRSPGVERRCEQKNEINSRFKKSFWCGGSVEINVCLFLALLKRCRNVMSFEMLFPVLDVTDFIQKKVEMDEDKERFLPLLTYVK
jgi:hypothetical protein